MAAPALVFHERKNHVPSFCPWQTKRPEEMKEVVIKLNGMPILDHKRVPITVDRIAPERRWAVRETGEVLEQHIFKDRYLAKWREWFRVAYNPPARIPSKDENEPIPNVTEYVRYEVDPTNPRSCRLIGYDPHEGKGRRPTVLTDSNGENPRPYDEVLLEQYDRDPSKMKEEERRYAAALRGDKPGMRAVEIAAELKLLTELFSKGKLTAETFAQEAAKLTGAKIIDEKPKVEAKQPLEVTETVEAPKELKVEDSDATRLECKWCGKKMPNLQGRKIHEIRWCKEHPNNKKN
jgi:hypothetical protein